MHITPLRLVLVAILASFTFAAPASARMPTQDQGRCSSNACHKRVALKQKQRLRKSCRSVSCKRRVARKQQTRAWARAVAPYRSWLASTRSCESGGNYRANTGNGFYGAYQFMVGTWATVGGSGLPSDASPLEQDYRAVLLMLRDGRGQWPVCG